MSANTIEYAPTLSADTFRGPSRSIWNACPVGDFIENPLLGMYFFDDFLVAGEAVMSSIYKNSFGQWSVYAAAGSLISDAAIEGGGLSITSGTDLDQTVLFGSAGGFRITTTSTLALNGKLWFEARVAKSSIATDICECFVGLADKQLSSGIPAVNLLFSGVDDTLATAPNLIGFYNKGDTAQTEWQFVYQLAAGTAVFPTGLTTLMNSITGAVLTANGFVKLGFLFDPFAYPKTISTASTGQTAGNVAKPLITVFVNGQPAVAFLTSTNVAGTSFPTGFLSPVFGCQQHATKGSFLIDWIRVAQIANS